MPRFALAVVSFVVGLLVIPAIIYVYLSFGRPPVAAADAPFPFEAKIVKVPLKARIDSEMPDAPAEPLNDANLTAGADIYQRECAFCHGVPDKQSVAGKAMYPSAPQLWVKHRNGVVGVSDDPAGETYWKVKNGIRLTGMPAYGSVLTEPQMWQVSLLLSTADKPLPASAAALLKP